MDSHVTQQLTALEKDLARYTYYLEKKNKSTDRLFQSVKDGYYESTLTNVGSIIEELLRDIWDLEKISGKGSKKTIEQLFSVIKNQVDIDRLAEDYVRDIQLARNRAAHGMQIVAEDALEALRKLSVILAWFVDQYLSAEDAAELLNTNTNSTTVETVNLIAGTGQGAQQNGALRTGAQTAVTRPPQAAPAQTPQAAAQSSTDSYYHTLEIEVSRDGDTLKTVTTNRGAVEEEETLRQFEEKTFNPDTIDDKCAEVIRLLNNANLRGAIAGENLSQLKSTGFALFEDLLPQDTQKKLADTTCENLIINIDDGLVHIPWELLYDGTSFICMKFNVGRVVRTRQKITKAQAKKLPVPLKGLILCDPRGDLKNASAEGNSILSELDKTTELIHADLVNSSIDYNGLRESIRNYDILHYAGHAEYDSASPEQSGWLLKESKFTSADIMQLSRNVALPSLVFSNACQSGQTAEWSIDNQFENRIFGMAHAFLVSGVQHYIGTFWEVIDEVSRDYAVSFYQNLVLGESIGASVRNARAFLISKYGEENIIWATYVLYGHPGFKYLKNDQEVPSVDEVPETAAPDITEAYAEGARSMPHEKKSNFMVGGSIAAAIIAAAVLTILFMRSAPGPVPPASTAPGAVIADAPQKKAADPAQVIKALAAKYRQQQQVITATPGPADLWTSKPVSLSLIGVGFSGSMEESAAVSDQLSASLMQRLHEKSSIELVEREKLDAILSELQLSTSDIADQDMAMIMLGRLVGARLIGSGKIVKLGKTLTVNLRIFETATSRIVISVDEDLDKKRPKSTAAALAREITKSIQKRYPIQGKIVKSTDEDIMLNIGSRQGVTEGMFFDIITGTEIKAANGKLLGYDQTQIAKVKVDSVQEQLCRAKVRTSDKQVVVGMLAKIRN